MLCSQYICCFKTAPELIYMGTHILSHTDLAKWRTYRPDGYPFIIKTTADFLCFLYGNIRDVLTVNASYLQISYTIFVHRFDLPVK